MERGSCIICNRTITTFGPLCFTCSYKYTLCKKCAVGVIITSYNTFENDGQKFYLHYDCQDKTANQCTAPGCWLPAPDGNLCPGHFLIIMKGCR